MGKPEAGTRTFTPMPSTACSKRPDSMSTTPSVRMPATLRPRQKMSFTHLMRASSPVTASMACAHATAAAQVRYWAASACSRGRSTTLRYTPAPAGE